VVASSVIDLGPTDAAGEEEGGDGMRDPRSTVTVAEEDDRAVGSGAAEPRRVARDCDWSSPRWPAAVSLACESISATVEDGWWKVGRGDARMG
jgi:hypothetical protein